MSKLNPKQEAFCREYLIDSNGKQAAIRAGYAPKNAEITASKYLRLSKFQEHLDKLRDKIESKKILTAIEIQEMLSARATDELDALGIKAIDILNKMQGAYVERVDMTVQQEVTYYAPSKDDSK